MDHIFEGSNYEKRIERLKLDNTKSVHKNQSKSEDELKRDKISKRAAQEFHDGMYGKPRIHNACNS